MKAKIFFILSLILIIPNLLLSQSIIGKWKGEINVLNQKLNIVVNFKTENDSLKGTIDIPQQMAFGLELTNIKTDKESVNFELVAGPGNIAFFEGEYLIDDSGNPKIEGKFLQMGIVGTFNLALTKEEVKKEETQSVQNFNDLDVKILSGVDTLGGTLSIPNDNTKKKFKCVILITGSGPQDRDEDVFGFKIFKEIATHLANSGIAVLRCDDRGVGQSTNSLGDKVTTYDYAHDVEACIKFLKNHPSIDTKKIGLLGHSEGGIIASIVASRNKDVAFAVLMAGTSIRGDSLLISQLYEITKASGASEEDIQEALRWQKNTLNAIRTDSGWDELREEMFLMSKKQIDTLPEAQKKLFPDSLIYQRVDLLISQSRNEWMRKFIQLDPSEYIVKIKCPVLALFGKLDTQVPPSTNEIPMRKALEKAKTKYEIKIFDKANHLFQEANTGSPNEYFMLEKKFVPGFLDYITNWILKI
ncbi:MAG: alpha/beta fold hydrolase [Candidatus Kapabacteria bacterium]|nr:alpha/beta fold hydrolase [Candidatus Kapabacteria bacterium]